MLSALTVAICSWNAPGVAVFTGSVPDAVDRYKDIPVAIRARLRERMERRDYDDVAEISRDRISGSREYADLREMHFGAGRVCAQVDRDGWSQQARERGLVYCEERHCIIVPTVCRNVARVTRLGVIAAPTGAVPGPVGLLPLTAIPTMEPSGSAVPGVLSFVPQALPTGIMTAQPGTGEWSMLAAAWSPPYVSPPAVFGGLIPIIPEPSTTLLSVLGVLALLGWKRPWRLSGPKE